MPLNLTLGSASAGGFGFKKKPFFTFTATISSNTSSYNIATQATSAGWNGVIPLMVFLTVNGGVSVSGTGNTTSSGLILPSSIPTKSIITLTNNGTIYGAGGSAGYNVQGGYYQEAGNTDGVGYGGDVPNNPYGDSGGYPAQNGTNGGDGGTAIYMATDCTFKIYNYGTIVGGGGGAGGGGSNNGGGGSGGNGGIALVETGTPTVTLYNQTGGLFAGGGGGGPGWGNRIEGSSDGGAPGYAATHSGPGNFGSDGSAGRSSTNNSTTLFNSAGTYSL